MTELGGPWKGRGALMNAMRSIIAAQQAAEKAALRERHALERRLLRERYRRFPDFKDWPNDHANLQSQTEGIYGDCYVRPVPADIRAYTHSIGGQGSVSYQKPGGDVAFTDFGKNIGISDYTNPDCVLAALQLSAQKWGSFEVYGNEEYKAICVSLAAEHGFKITNPELQPLIVSERERSYQCRRNTGGFMPS